MGRAAEAFEHQTSYKYDRKVLPTRGRMEEDSSINNQHTYRLHA